MEESRIIGTGVEARQYKPGGPFAAHRTGNWGRGAMTCRMEIGGNSLDRIFGVKTERVIH